MNHNNTVNAKCPTCGASVRVSVALSSVYSCNDFIGGLGRQRAVRELTASCSQLEASKRKLELDIVKLRGNETANLAKAITVKEENVSGRNENEGPNQKKSKATFINGQS